MMSGGSGGGAPPRVSKRLVGEIGCVSTPISAGKRGKVRILGREYAAASGEDVGRGRWVRVVSCVGRTLSVRPLNVWLGSCCC